MKYPVLIAVVIGILAFFTAASLIAAVIPDSSAIPPQAPGTPVFISTGDSEAGQSNGIAFDASGAATAVWEETDTVLAKRYDGKSNGESNAQGWSTTTKIVIRPQTEPVATNVVSLAPGHMLAFWSARDVASKAKGGWPYGTWSASYTQKGTDKGQWTAAVPVSKTVAAMSTNREQIAVAAGGDPASAKAIAVWQE
jgi:hypothetical protein